MSASFSPSKYKLQKYLEKVSQVWTIWRRSDTDRILKLFLLIVCFSLFWLLGLIADVMMLVIVNCLLPKFEWIKYMIEIIFFFKYCSWILSRLFCTFFVHTDTNLSQHVASVKTCCAPLWRKKQWDVTSRSIRESESSKYRYSPDHDTVILSVGFPLS